MKPILFNTEMVRSILDGRKTVTRRVIKPQPVCNGKNITIPKHDGDFFLSAEKKWIHCRECGHDPQYSRESSNVSHHWIPPYLTGDILYVRETWKQATADYAGGGYGLKDLYLYKADQDVDTAEMLVEAKWHPSTHMPKEAARIFLRVTNVRVERLQKMTDEDFMRDFGFCLEAIQAVGRGALEKPFWDSTIKPADQALYGWDANPWVWVIEFERVEKAEVIHNG